jgi:hypothetical protein
MVGDVTPAVQSDRTIGHTGIIAPTRIARFIAPSDIATVIDRSN